MGQGKMSNSKQSGYGYKNYLIESSWKSVRGAGILSATLAAMPLTAFWINVAMFVALDWQVLALLLPASVILWIGLWWAMFDRLVTYVSWLANYREMYEVWASEHEQAPPPPPQKRTTVYNQLDKTTYTIDHYVGGEGGPVDKASANSVH